MPTNYRRIQVTEDPDLADALRIADPHLTSGTARSRQVRDLAIVGARHLASASTDCERRRVLLDELGEHFRAPATAPWDREVVVEGKRRSSPIR